MIDFDDDPLRFEKLFPGSITFLDSQKGDRNFIHSFMTQADIRRMSSDCDLVPLPYRQTSSLSSDRVGQSSILNIRTMLHNKRTNEMPCKLSNKCLNMHMNQLVESVKSSTDESKLQRLEEHLSSNCKYNAFKFSNMGDDDQLMLSSFFTSIRDRARYQACDRLGTYSKETYEFCSMLMYEYVE